MCLTILVPFGTFSLESFHIFQLPHTHTSAHLILYYYSITVLLILLLLSLLSVCGCEIVSGQICMYQMGIIVVVVAAVVVVVVIVVGKTENGKWFSSWGKYLFCSSALPLSIIWYIVYKIKCNVCMLCTIHIKYVCARIVNGFVRFIFSLWSLAFIHLFIHSCHC